MIMQIKLKKFKFPEGLIIESLPNGMSETRLDNEDLILGYISGMIQSRFIQKLPRYKSKN